MSGWVPPSLPARWSDPARPVFVGRRAELATLEEVWTAAAAGLRQVVFVGGEPGAGKSRLLAEAASALHRQGAGVLLGTCSAEFGPPYQPFVEPIEALLSRLPVQERDAERLRTLAGRSKSAADHDSRGELFDAAVEAVRAAAQQAPLVLVLEDLHWAGPGVAAAAVLPRRAHRGLPPVGACHAPHQRPGPVRSAGRHDRRAVSARRRAAAGPGRFGHRGHRRVPASRRSAVAETGAQLGGRPAGPDRRQPVLPARAVARPRRRGGRLDELRAPVSVRDTVAGRLDKLTVPERQTLELAAVIGEDVDVATLLAAAEWSSDTTLTALDGAAAVGLLESAAGASGAVRFPHALRGSPSSS